MRWAWLANINFGNIILYGLSDQHNTKNDFISIYSSHSLQHILAGNYGQHKLMLE
jgi:hypothetical protein